MKSRNKVNFKRLPITKKVIILYGILFTFSIIGISCVFMYSARSIGAGVVFTNLKNLETEIENYIKKGGEISEDTINELLADDYVDYIIENKITGERFTSINMHGYGVDGNRIREYPIPIAPKEGADDRSSTQAYSESSDNPTGHRVVNPFFQSSDYTVYSKNGKDFISVEGEVGHNGNVYVIRLLKSSADIMMFVKLIETKLFYIDIIGILISLLIGKYISRVLLKPVRKIRETAERITAEDLGERIEIEGPDDELKELSVTFNSMIDRLSRSFEQQSRFVSDASHELRTPIAVIKGYANLINRWGKDDPEILQEAVTNILEETDHMSVMIKNLLFLARSDQHRNHVQKRPMSLNDAINDIAKDLSVTDESVNINLDICQEELIINGDPDLIKQMLWIYTENAVKYSGQEKTVTYKLWKENNFACVGVGDNGCGISEEDITHIFDRFYRVDKSRNKEIPGNGLGLSIAKWIVDIHLGKIEVKSHIGEGTEFINKFKIS